MKSQQKKCNPQLSSRSFKERNPDLNIDEIQNNPNVPDDIKAELCGLNVGGPNGFYDADAYDDDGRQPANGRMPQAVHLADTSVEQLILDKYDDMYDSDEDRSRRSRRSKKAIDDDEDWYVTKRERAAPKKVVRRPKRKSDEGVEKAVVSKTPRRKRVAPKRGSEESSESSASMSSPSEAGSQTSKVAAAAKNRRTPKKQPPQLPFSLPFDLSKKFEGKIPNRKGTIVTAAMAAAAATAGATTPTTPAPASAGAMSPPATGDRAINVKTVSSTSSQSIAAMLSAGPGKHERKQDKTSIWRNSAQTLNAATPVRINYMKPAIIYPPPSRRSDAAEVESKTAAVMQPLANGQYYESNGVSDAGGGGGAGSGSRSSNYVAKVSI